MKILHKITWRINMNLSFFFHFVYKKKIIKTAYYVVATTQFFIQLTQAICAAISNKPEKMI